LNAAQELWWKQAKADLELFEHLRGRPGWRYPCHSLQALQMASEKIAKASFRAGHYACDFGLTDAERAQLLLGNTQSRFVNRLCWAKIHLERAGLLTRGRRHRAWSRARSSGHSALGCSPRLYPASSSLDLWASIRRTSRRPPLTRGIFMVS
jgi:hypothetical protein